VLPADTLQLNGSRTSILLSVDLPCLPLPLPLLLQDMLRRPVGPPRRFVNPFADPKAALGYSEWGFTKANELFAGRIAMLVSAAYA
jgi:hypothetical protein